MNNNIYLDKTKKEKYMKGFLSLLEFEKDFWKIDNGLKEILININKNKFIQTLYSKGYSGNLNNISHDKSYLTFCYSKEIELQLFRCEIPDLVFNYNNEDYSTLYYDFSYPKSNCNYKSNSNFGLDCIDNADYFSINHISITLKAINPSIHKKFWLELDKKLENVKPK